MATRTPLRDERATEATDAMAATGEEAGITIRGLTRTSWVRHIERAQEKVPGVRAVGVNLATERASVTFDPGQTTLDQLAADGGDDQAGAALGLRLQRGANPGSHRRPGDPVYAGDDGDAGRRGGAIERRGQ